MYSICVLDCVFKMINRFSRQTSSCVTGSEPADGVWSCRKGHVCVCVCVHMSYPFNTLCMSVFVSIIVCMCLCRLPRGHWKMKLLKISRAGLTGAVIHSHSSTIFPQQSHISQQRTTPDLSLSSSLQMPFHHLFKIWGERTKSYWEMQINFFFMDR